MAPIEPPEVERKHAVATGASQGLGRALLDAFLAHGYCVSFCARRAERIAEITAALTADSHGDRICGYAADISAPTEMAVFWQVLSQRFGTATASGVPLAGTRAQGFGSLYSMGGAGGRYVPGMVGYGTTKCALQYLTDGLAPEHRDTNVLVGSISPGLVRTETVARGIPHIPPAMRASRFEFMNAIAELPTTSAAWIVAQTSSNRRNGVRLVWLTRRRLLLRLLQRKLRPRRVLQDWAAAGGPDCSDSAT